jgi:hypothetical protein
MTAWFTRDDATEIVKNCFDFACVVLRIGFKLSEVLPMPQTHTRAGEATL